jgi:hypothetical protein
MCGRKSGPVPGFVYLGQAKKDDQFALYRRENDPVLKQRDEEYQALHSKNGKAAHAHKTNGTAPRSATDWSARVKQYRRTFTPELRKELADDLGLPEHVFDFLGVGYMGQGPHKDDDGNSLGGCWTFPEFNATGLAIGITCRYRNGQKKAMPGGSRGLFIPSEWQNRDGPVFLVEGPSDTLALTAMSLPAIGRPNCTGGVDNLAELLRGLPPDRQIVVLGEFDVKHDGRWPGRDGAVQVAAQLSQLMGRKVRWALPPQTCKDTL